MKVKKFDIVITIESDIEVGEDEMMMMRNNIAHRLEGYTTVNPNYLGNYTVELNFNHDSINNSSKRQE